MTYDISKFNKLCANSPGNEDNHYAGGIQVVHFAAANRMIFTLANICKYVDRYKKKGKPVQDLEKALWYTRFQMLDHPNFRTAFRPSDCISPEIFFESHPEYNSYQKEIINKVFEYNWWGQQHQSHCSFCSVEGLLESCIKEEKKCLKYLFK